MCQTKVPPAMEQGTPAVFQASKPPVRFAIAEAAAKCWWRSNFDSGLYSGPGVSRGPISQSRLQLPQRDAYRVLDYASSYFSRLANIENHYSVRLLVAQLDEPAPTGYLWNIVKLEAALNSTCHAFPPDIRQDSRFRRGRARELHRRTGVPYDNQRGRMRTSSSRMTARYLCRTDTPALRDGCSLVHVYCSHCSRETPVNYSRISFTVTPPSRLYMRPETPARRGTAVPYHVRGPHHITGSVQTR